MFAAQFRTMFPTSCCKSVDELAAFDYYMPLSNRSVKKKINLVNFTWIKLWINYH